MGKNLIQQARGKGSPRYRAPSFRYKGESKLRTDKTDVNGEVIDIMHAADLPNIKAISKIVKKYYLCWPKDVSLSA